MLHLRYATPQQWKAIAAENLDAFLQDHCHNERKVAHTAMMIAAHYHERRELVAAMVDLALEETQHFKQVHDLLAGRGQTIGQDAPDPYMGPMRRMLRKGDANHYLLDRLLQAAIVEARGCERFKMIGEALPPGEIQRYYQELVACEARHHALFLRLARQVADEASVQARFGELLDAEAELVASLPLRPALH